MSQAASQPVATHTAASRADASEVALRACYAACAEVVRRRARNFYHGLRLTPEPKRSAIYAVYAWMREADDAVDSPGTPEEKRQRLAALGERTESILLGDKIPRGEGFVWPAFADTIRRYGIDRREVRAMLEGMAEDLAAGEEHNGNAGGLVIYRTRDDLQAYCYRVASVVGRICVRIWGLRAGVDEAEAMRLAERRGLAFQLTNILRDFREDHDDHRVYLPLDDFDRHALSPTDLLRFEPAEPCAAMITDLAAWARREYTASAALESMIEPRCVAAMWAMTRIYSGLLEQIEAEPSRIASEKRIRLASARKASIGLGALMRARLGAMRSG
ncbi:MAG: phytoene/squalene synthase family protein [Planctomycetota bacterium]